jgi:hypothetical protein
VLAVIPKATDDREYHPKFASDRAQGEWFRPSQTLLNFIADIPKSDYTGFSLTSAPINVSPEPTETTEQKLQIILESVEPCLAEDITNHFYLRDPISFAKLLVSLSLPDKIAGGLLAIRVGLPYREPNLQPLFSRAMDNFWKRLSIQSEALYAN